MVAYTKDEEDYLFDIWKSVRKQDGDKGILNSSSNRQRYLKIYEAYRNQGYSRTYAQVETKLKKHRSSFIKTYNGGTCTEINPTGCPRYQDLLEMFAEIYRGCPYVPTPVKVKDEPFSYLNLNGDSNIVFDTSELQDQGNNNGFLKELESIQLKNNSLDHSSLDVNDAHMPRKLSYINNSQSVKHQLNHSTGQHAMNMTSAQQHTHTQQQQLLKQQQRHQRDITNTLQQIRDGNREHSRVLNQGLQMLSAAITKLVDSKVSSPASSKPLAMSPQTLSTTRNTVKSKSATPPRKSTPVLLSTSTGGAGDGARGGEEEEEDKCTFVDHEMINRNDNEVHIPLVQTNQCTMELPLVNVGQCDDDEIDDEMDDVINEPTN